MFSSILAFLLRIIHVGQDPGESGLPCRRSSPAAAGRVSGYLWLFAGSERGGQAAAVLFGLIETARLNGVEPYAYLKDVLTRINTHGVDRLEELLPMNWTPAPA